MAKAWLLLIILFVVFGVIEVLLTGKTIMFSFFFDFFIPVVAIGLLITFVFGSILYFIDWFFKKQ